MTEKIELTIEELSQLTGELKREDLQCYTAIVMSCRDLKAGNIDTIILRLKLDSDKWRAYDSFLNGFLKQFEYDGDSYRRVRQI